MNYEKKYKEAQGWIEKIYPTLQHEQQMEAEAFFPELAESKDERIRKAIHIYLDWLDGHKDYQPKGDYTIKDMLIWLEKQGEQKPQRMISAEAKEAMYAKPAWSEEDEVKINRIVACLENLNVADNDILLKDVDWLKSLKERIQPKVKWSEEDEKKRTLLISILEVNHPNGYFKVNPANTLNMEVMHTEELVDWLKSLRPQNRWKPSDEQMKALLSEVEAWTKGCPKQVILESLYNDLKKLKG